MIYRAHSTDIEDWYKRPVQISPKLFEQHPDFWIPVTVIDRHSNGVTVSLGYAAPSVSNTVYSTQGIRQSVTMVIMDNGDLYHETIQAKDVSKASRTLRLFEAHENGVDPRFVD